MKSESESLENQLDKLNQLTNKMKNQLNQIKNQFNETFNAKSELTKMQPLKNETLNIDKANNRSIIKEIAQNQIPVKPLSPKDPSSESACKSKYKLQLHKLREYDLLGVEGELINVFLTYRAIFTMQCVVGLQYITFLEDRYCVVLPESKSFEIANGENLVSQVDDVLRVLQKIASIEFDFSKEATSDRIIQTLHEQIHPLGEEAAKKEAAIFLQQLPIRWRREYDVLVTAMRDYQLQEFGFTVAGLNTRSDALNEANLIEYLKYEDSWKE